MKYRYFVINYILCILEIKETHMRTINETIQGRLKYNATG